MMILTGRFMYRVLKHCVGVELELKEDCCIGPIPFWWFSTPLYATYLLNIWFSGTTYHRDLKQVPLDLAHCNPKFTPLKPFQCILTSQNQLKCEIFGYLLNSPWQKMKNMSICTRKNVFEKAWKSAHIGFLVCQLQCTMLELCVRSTFVELWWFFLIFDSKV